MQQAVTHKQWSERGGGGISFTNNKATPFHYSAQLVHHDLQHALHHGNCRVPCSKHTVGFSPSAPWCDHHPPLDSLRHWTLYSAAWKSRPSPTPPPTPLPGFPWPPFTLGFHEQDEWRLLYPFPAVCMVPVDCGGRQIIHRKAWSTSPPLRPWQSRMVTQLIPVMDERKTRMTPWIRTFINLKPLILSNCSDMILCYIYRFRFVVFSCQGLELFTSKTLRLCFNLEIFIPWSCALGLQDAQWASMELWVLMFLSVLQFNSREKHAQLTTNNQIDEHYVTLHVCTNEHVYTHIHVCLG